MDMQISATRESSGPRWHEPAIVGVMPMLTEARGGVVSGRSSKSWQLGMTWRPFVTRHCVVLSALSAVQAVWPVMSRHKVNVMQLERHVEKPQDMFFAEKCVTCRCGSGIRTLGTQMGWCAQNSVPLAVIYRFLS